MSFTSISIVDTIEKCVFCVNFEVQIMTGLSLTEAVKVITAQNAELVTSSTNGFLLQKGIWTHRTPFPG